MEKILVTTTVNDNKVQLVQKDKRFFIYWGEAANGHMTQTELLTPTGKIPSPSSANKKFIQAVNAAKYLKFSKL